MEAAKVGQNNPDLRRAEVYDRLKHAFSAAESARRELAIRLASEHAPRDEVDWRRTQFQQKLQEFSESVQACLNYLKSSIVLNGKRKIRL